MKGFSQYIAEADKGITVAWGRMNPPTVGHEKLMDATARASSGGNYAIYLTQTQNDKKDPLSYEQKVKYARKMFPRHGRKIMFDKKIKTLFDLLVKLYDDGYGKVTLVAGSDRVPEYQTLANKYNGVKARHGFYNFQGGVNIVSAGERDPDAEGVSGMSASKMRAAASAGDLKQFSMGLPSGYRDGPALFNDVRRGMKLSPIKDFREHIQLDPVSDTRELFVEGKLFAEGDVVVVKESDEVGEVIMLGSNYVLVEMADGKRVRKWLDAVEKIEENLDEGALIPDWFHKLTLAPKMKGMLRYYLDYRKKHPGEGNKAVQAAVKHMGLTPRDGNLLKDYLNKQIQLGKMPKHLALEATTPQDSEISDRKGTQPARYHAGLEKSTKAKRDAQFKKQSKMDSRDPKAYKPAPGDATAETKPSKYTKTFKQMYGEAAQHVDATQERIKREKEADKLRHDRMMDAARTRDTKAANAKSVREGLTTFIDVMSEEASKSIADKAKKSGISASTLRKVYNRGVAAWRTGHRPGTTPEQWGHARVNAFIVKKKNGNLNHDKDLA